MICRAMFLLFLEVLLVSCAPRRSAIALYTRPSPTPYHYPLISPGAQFASLPPAVQHSVRAETGSAEIEDIVKDTNSVPVVYRVYFVNRQAFPPMYLTADGSVLNPDLSVAMGAVRDHFGVLFAGPTSNLTLSDLPAKVVTVVQNQAPDAEVDAIYRETRGDQSIYTVTFKGRRHAELRVSSEGAILPDTTIHVHTQPGTTK